MGSEIPLVAMKLLSAHNRPSAEAETELEKLRSFGTNEYKDSWLSDGLDVHRLIAAYCETINAAVPDFEAWLARDWISVHMLEDIVAGRLSPTGFDASMAYGFSTCGAILKFAFTIDMLLIASPRLPAASSLAKWEQMLQANDGDLLLAYVELEYLQASSLVRDNR